MELFITNFEYMNNMFIDREIREYYNFDREYYYN